eukprot:TRINITY_DN3266_c0_g1_i5.p1 TRINITY_DN3266_c0_g1~~TRINITY_DN3266_c0_g1_i5.p1  ORF type:complete len:438 (-),score=112.00 TRINITY_DN3266_c0_g1_i5:23-1336(-)
MFQISNLIAHLTSFLGFKNTKNTTKKKTKQMTKHKRSTKIFLLRCVFVLFLKSKKEKQKGKAKKKSKKEKQRGKAKRKRKSKMDDTRDTNDSDEEMHDRTVTAPPRPDRGQRTLFGTRAQPQSHDSPKDSATVKDSAKTVKDSAKTESGAVMEGATRVAMASGKLLSKDGFEVLPWVEKYRPSALDELIAHHDIIASINRLIESQKLPHLLFYGPPGTGKTSTILAIARKLYGANYNSMILELNASDDRTISVVREQIKDFASTRMVFNAGFKLIILDEADAMTREAQTALRRVIEKYTKNTRFCFICNYVSKIIPAIQSRCTRFRFGPLAKDQVVGRLKVVCQKENVDVSEDAFEALEKLGGGDMRRSLNILQSTHMASGVVCKETIYACTGSPFPSDIEYVVSMLMSEAFATAFSNIHQLKIEKGLALTDLLREV